MKPRDWFSVGIRLLGAWMFVRGFEYILTFADMRMKLSPPSRSDNSFGMAFYMWYAAGYWTLAVLFIFGAEWITGMSFGEKEQVIDDEDFTDHDNSHP